MKLYFLIFIQASLILYTSVKADDNAESTTITEIAGEKSSPHEPEIEHDTKVVDELTTLVDDHHHHGTQEEENVDKNIMKTLRATTPGGENEKAEEVVNEKVKEHEDDKKEHEDEKKIEKEKELVSEDEKVKEHKENEQLEEVKQKEKVKEEVEESKNIKTQDHEKTEEGIKEHENEKKTEKEESGETKIKEEKVSEHIEKEQGEEKTNDNMKEKIEEEGKLDLQFPTNVPKIEDDMEKLAKLKPISTISDIDLENKLSNSGSHENNHLDHNKENENPNFQFPADSNNKVPENEFDKLAKLQPTYSTVSDIELEKKLAGDSNHMDHNTENENPTFIFPNENKNKIEVEPEDGEIIDHKIHKVANSKNIENVISEDSNSVKKAIDKPEDNIDLRTKSKNSESNKLSSNEIDNLAKKGEALVLPEDSNEDVNTDKKTTNTQKEKPIDNKIVSAKENKPSTEKNNDKKQDSKENHSSESSTMSKESSKEKLIPKINDKSIESVTKDNKINNDKTKNTKDNLSDKSPVIELDKSKTVINKENNIKTTASVSQKSDINKENNIKTTASVSQKSDINKENNIKTTVAVSQKSDTKGLKPEQMTEEQLIQYAKKFDETNNNYTTVAAATYFAAKFPTIPGENLLNATVPPPKVEDDGTNINTTLLFVEIIMRHGDRYKGYEEDETYPNDPYYEEDPFWKPYGWNQLRNNGKMRAHWLGKFLRRRYNGFLKEEYYHHDIKITSADLDRCIDSATVMTTGLYPPKGINFWNDNVGRYYQPIPVRTLAIDDDIYINEDVPCVPYEIELEKVLTNNMNNFNAKYRYVYEYLEMFSGMPVINLEDVAQIYTTLRIEHENGRKLPEWTVPVYPTMLRMLNSYYNQILTSSDYFKRIKAGPLLTILLDEIKLKIENRMKPNYKMKFWSGFDTTILKLLYTFKEIQPSLEKAEDLLETDYSGSLILEIHLINKKYFAKVLYINMDCVLAKSKSPRVVKICDGLTLCPLETFFERMNKFKIYPKEWFNMCNMTYCSTEPYLNIKKNIKTDII